MSIKCQCNLVGFIVKIGYLQCENESSLLCSVSNIRFGSGTIHNFHKLVLPSGLKN